MEACKRTSRWSELPPEIWRQVLARLPPKTLMQIRSVCRNWLSLIDDSDFISMHSNFYRNDNAQLLTLETGGRSYTFALRQFNTFQKIADLFEFPNSYVFCDNSLVNGLLLLSSSEENSRHLTLLNPSLRKSLALPRCPLRGFGSHFLGYAASKGDYKVVVLDISNARTRSMSVAIYSLCEHCWSRYAKQLPKWAFNFILWGYGFVYLDGAVYWKPSPLRTDAEDPELLYFDFDSEEFRYMKLPDVEGKMNIFLFIFGGSLAVFGICRVRSCIWVLEKNGGNEVWRQYWNGDSCLDLYRFLENFPPVLLRCSQFMFMEDTETLLFTKSAGLMAYNIRSNQMQLSFETISFSYMDTYVESLVLHKGYDNAGQQYKIVGAE